MTDEEIITAIAFENAPDETKQQVVDSIRRTVELRVIGMVGDLITPEQEEKLNQLVSGDDTQAVWEWLKTQVVGVDTREIYEATLQDYLATYKEHEFTV